MVETKRRLCHFARPITARRNRADAVPIPADARSQGVAMRRNNPRRGGRMRLASVANGRARVSRVRA